jgi:Zn-dependent oligopeptidase
MKRTPYTAKDFAWVKMTPKQIQKFAGEALELKTLNYKKIKAILPEHRTFENTVYALEISDGEYGDIFQQIGILGEVSPSKDVRDAVHTVMTEMSQKLVDIEYDKGLYTALVEYHEGNFEDEKKKLGKDSIKLLTEALREYRRMGFDLPDAKQRELKKLIKQSSKLSFEFGKNINDYDDYLYCTREELDGLSERFIAGLPMTDDGKYIVSLAYPHMYPFLAEAKNRGKRQELPQLINVLQGKLSLIGPRAITKEELKRYETSRDKFLSVKPGITGLWQVSGRNNLTYEDRVKLDVYYVQNWSLWLDIKILFKTIGAVLSRSGE